MHSAPGHVSYLLVLQQLHHLHGTDEEVTTIRVLHQGCGQGLVLPKAPLRQGELQNLPLLGPLQGKLARQGRIPARNWLAKLLSQGQEMQKCTGGFKYYHTGLSLV